MNKILRKINSEMKFRFTGLDSEDETKLADLRKKEVETRLTVNELRKMDGYAPLKGKYADVYANEVLNPQAVQLINAEKQAETQQQQMEMQDEESPPGGEGGDEEDPDQGAEVDWETLFTKAMKEDKTIKLILK